jgi:hypothetical protein
MVELRDVFNLRPFRGGACRTPFIYGSQALVLNGVLRGCPSWFLTRTCVRFRQQFVMSTNAFGNYPLVPSRFR